MAGDPRRENSVLHWTTFSFAIAGFLHALSVAAYAHYLIPPMILLAIIAGMARLSERETCSSGFIVAARWFRYLLACWGGLLLCLFAMVFASEYDQRQRSNENRARNNLRSYFQAQSLFSSRKGFAVPGNTSAILGDGAFADNYRNLYYGLDKESRQYRFISKGMADDFLVDNALSGTPTRREGGEAPKTTGSNRRYYFFIEDVSGDLPASAYGTRCALMDLPARLGDTGRYVFWVNQDGEIYRQKPAASNRSTAEELLTLYQGASGSTPLTGPEKWERIEDTKW